MCWIVFSDAHKITNESYMYAKLIENNEEPTGLALKNKINTKEVEKINDKKTCQAFDENASIKHFLN